MPAWVVFVVISVIAAMVIVAVFPFEQRLSTAPHRSPAARPLPDEPAAALVPAALVPVGHGSAYLREDRALRRAG